MNNKKKIFNWYRCPHCKKEVSREGSKKWIKSYCDDTDQEVRLQLFYPIKTTLNKMKTKSILNKKQSARTDKELIDMITGRGDNKSGFFDLPKDQSCKDPEHNPPGYMVIPKGKGYHHVCPTCGKETTVIPTQYTLNANVDGFIEWLKGENTEARDSSMSSASALNYGAYKATMGIYRKAKKMLLKQK